jgi:S1-C subfamily serine protease
MMSSVVGIRVNIRGLYMDPDGVIVPSGLIGWTGSGVVYGNRGGHSLILSANHVLETPKVDQIVPYGDGVLLVKMVEIIVSAPDEHSCALTVTKVSGSSELNDLAIGEAACEVGIPATFATVDPPEGSKVYIAGHPAGAPLVVVTDGYLTGRDSRGFMISSAPIVGGSSGGPVFYNGKVIGIEVRGLAKFEHFSIFVPLSVIQAFLRP